MKVLVVDDDAATLALLEAGITGAGHEVAKARNGEAAWELLAREQDFRVVVVDWNLPGFDGLELCRRIRQASFPGYTYVILVTVESGRNRFLRAMESGIDDFVTKPIDFGVMGARLRVAERIVHMQSELHRLRTVIPVCLKCFKVQDDDQQWRRVDEYIARHAGTVSHAFCPACVVEEGRDPRPRRGSRSSMQARKQPTVLLIDDSEALLVLTQAVLEEAGFRVYTRPTGEEGLRALSEEPPDVALIDVSLGDVSGDEVVKRAKRRPELSQVQMLLFSGRSDAELDALAKAAGADGYVRKTARPEDLVAKISSLVVHTEEERPSGAPRRELTLEPKVHALRHALSRIAAGSISPEARHDAFTIAHQLAGIAGSIGEAPIGEGARTIEAELRDGGALSETAWERINRALEGFGLKPVASTAYITRPSTHDVTAARPRVLVVDAKPQAQLIAKELGDRFEVIVPSTTVETLQRAQRASVIVTDVDTPELRGLGLLAALRRRGSPAKVIVCTQESEAGTFFKAVPLGATAIVPKPLRQGALAKAIDIALAQDARIGALGLAPADLDALREVFSVSAGKAVRSLGQLLRREVKVTAARAIAVRPDELFSILKMGIGGAAAMVRNDFSGAIAGTGWLLLGAGVAAKLVRDLAQRKPQETLPPLLKLTSIERATLNEVGNMVIGPLLGSFLRSLDAAGRLEEPVCQDELAIEDVARGAQGEYVLALEALFETPHYALAGKAAIVLGSVHMRAIVHELGRMLA